MNDYVNTFDNPVVVGYFSMTHTIMNDRKLSYFDILYDGNYGYNGIKKITFDGIEKDYIEVLYQGKDKIYIPVEKIDNLNKFSGKEGMVPKINKLGGTEWQKTKNRV